MAQQNPRLDSLLNEKDSIVVQQRLRVLETGNEEDKGVVLRYYAARKDVVKRDSLLDAIVQQYPNGRHAASTGITKILAAKGVAQKEAMFATYRVQFPESSFNKILFSLAKACAEEHQTEKALMYMEQVTGGPALRPEAVCTLAEMLSAYDGKTAETLLQKELEVTRKAYLNPEPGIVIQRQNSIRLGYYMLLKTYGRLLLDRKDNAHALEFIKPAYDTMGRYYTELQRDYMVLLSRTGKYQEAFGLLDNMYRNGKGDAEVKKELAVSYGKLNPGKDGAEYVASIHKGLKEEVQENVAKMLISEPAPAFEVKDINGKTVSLADFKGKIIVLDFWATWCGPCKKSFPAMQQAVKKYSKDKNVKFLFIHTWEQSAHPLEDARNYLKGQQFNFDLYMDTKDPVSRKNPAVTLFGVKGIPAKFVIDGEGNIRFKMTGFSGGDDTALAELSAMIDMVAGNKKSK